jgi:hypothetical protein
MRGIRWVFLFVMLWCAGCGTSLTALKPSVKGEPLHQMEADAIIERLWVRDNEIRTLRALARSTFVHGDDSQSVRQIFVFQKPDKLRLETLALQTATTLSLVTSREGIATYLDPGQKEAKTGNAESQFFNALLHIPASEQELMSLISGRVPSRFLVPGELEVYRNGDGTLSLVKGNFLYYWLVDEADLSVRECQIRDVFKDNLLFRVVYEGRRVEDNIVLPETIHLHMPADRFETRIGFGKITVNAPIPAGLFNVAIPSDYSVR